jgi:hypothetical protein
MSRHNQLDLFSANQFRVASGRMQLLLLEHPFFSLQSRSRDMSAYSYTSNDGLLTLKVEPSTKGRATMRDSDFLCYLQAKLVAMKQEGRLNTDNPKILVEAAEFLQFAHRGDSGASYKNLRDMLDRLGGTKLSIYTRDKAGRIEMEEHTTWIDPEWRGVREMDNNVLLTFEVKPREWLVQRVREADHYLSIPRRFFNIRSDTHRRYWQIGRMHAKCAKPFLISWEKFFNKVGSNQPFAKFRSKLRKEIRDNGGTLRILEYTVAECDDRRRIAILSEAETPTL